MKRGGLIALVVVAVLLMMVGGCLVGNYNRLVTKKESVDQRWAQVNNQLQRRNDLIGNLAETVKGTATQEQAVFGAIADARAQMAGARTTEQGIEAGRAMDTALGRLLVVVENYPQLKSNEAFVQLMDELAGTENRLATERMRYNEEVQAFNVLVKRFPTNLYATMFNFKEGTYYQVAEGAKAVPKVDFSGLKKPLVTGQRILTGRASCAPRRRWPVVVGRGGPRAFGQNRPRGWRRTVRRLRPARHHAGGARSGVARRPGMRHAIGTNTSTRSRSARPAVPPWSVVVDSLRSGRPASCVARRAHRGSPRWGGHGHAFATRPGEVPPPAWVARRALPPGDPRPADHRRSTDPLAGPAVSTGPDRRHVSRSER